MLKKDLTEAIANCNSLLHFTVSNIDVLRSSMCRFSTLNCTSDKLGMLTPPTQFHLQSPKDGFRFPSPIIRKRQKSLVSAFLCLSVLLHF